MKKSIRFTRSTGNVFEDLGLSNPGERLAKAQLAFFIGELIESRELTQMAAAEILGILQPKVSDLVNGKLSGFSVERLFHFLNLLDQDVEIIVHPKRHIQRPATVSILAARGA